MSLTFFYLLNHVLTLFFLLVCIRKTYHPHHSLIQDVMASLTFSPSLSLSLSFFLHLSPSILYLVPLSGRICINEYLPITQSVLPNAAYVRHDSYPSLLTLPRNHLSVCLNVKVTLFGSQAQWTPGG